MKDKLQTALGTFGSILYWVLIIFITVLPVVMIGAPFWLSAIIFLICSFVPYLSLPLWIWGLVEAIKGPQDVFAIIYYIATVIIFLPTIISMFSSLINKTKETKLNKAESAEGEPKKKKSKSRLKTATIILSITTAMFAISTIGLSIGFANQIENLENTIEKKETAIHLLSNEIDDLEEQLKKGSFADYAKTLPDDTSDNSKYKFNDAISPTAEEIREQVSNGTYVYGQN